MRQRMIIKNQMFLLFVQSSFLARILFVSLFTSIATTANTELNLKNEEITVSALEPEINDDLSIVHTTSIMQTANFDEVVVPDATEPPKYPTSTIKTKKTRTTKHKNGYTKDSPRQRPTISRLTRRPFRTGPYSLYQRTSISPLIISYPTKETIMADPVAEPHPLNINLSVYLYPQKDENESESDDQNDEDVIEKPEITKKKPILLSSETIPVVPADFEPVIDIQLNSNKNKKKV